MKDTVKIKNKGQALVEFVMLLPIILMILFIIIDFASVFYNKNHLEGILDDVVLMKQNNKSLDEINSAIDDDTITVTITEKGELVEISLEKAIDFVTPFSDTFFKDDYKINTKRVIFNE